MTLDVGRSVLIVIDWLVSRNDGMSGARGHLTRLFSTAFALKSLFCFQITPRNEKRGHWHGLGISSSMIHGTKPVPPSERNYTENSRSDARTRERVGLMSIMTELTVPDVTNRFLLKRKIGNKLEWIIRHCRNQNSWPDVFQPSDVNRNGPNRMVTYIISAVRHDLVPVWNDARKRRCGWLAEQVMCMCCAWASCWNTIPCSRGRRNCFLPGLPETFSLLPRRLLSFSLFFFASFLFLYPIFF